MQIEINIDELVLDGIVPQHPQQLIAAIEQALHALLAERGIPSAWQQGGHLPSVTRSIKPNSQPADIGQQVAQAIAGIMPKG